MYIRKEVESKLVYASTDGRLLMLEISKGGEEILLVNIYAQKKCNKNLSATEEPADAKARKCVLWEILTQ